jgi:hypothetical protein
LQRRDEFGWLNFSEADVDKAPAVEKISEFLSPRYSFIRHACAMPAAACGRLQRDLCQGSMPMADFLFVYRGASGAVAEMTPEEMQQHMQKWEKWIGEGMRKGWMTNPGDALTPEGRVVSAKVITDGPFVESKEIVGGYSIVQADSIDAAAQLAKGCPGLLVGGTVEVRTLAGYKLKNE